MDLAEAGGPPSSGAGLLELSKHAIRMPVSLLCVFLWLPSAA